MIKSEENLKSSALFLSHIRLLDILIGQAAADSPIKMSSGPGATRDVTKRLNFKIPFLLTATLMETQRVTVHKVRFLCTKEVSIS